MWLQIKFQIYQREREIYLSIGAQDTMSHWTRKIWKSDTWQCVTFYELLDCMWRHGGHVGGQEQ